MIVLVGFMGAGKTTVGHILAERLGMPFVDSDLVIEQRLGRSVREVFETEGEDWFRQLEHSIIDELLRGPDAVLALGGGSLGDARTRAILRNARVVYLDVAFAEAMERVRGDEYRPMLRRPGLEGLHSERLGVYRDVAAITVDTNGRRPEAVAQELLGQLVHLPSTPETVKSVFVSPVGGTYYAHVGSSILPHVASLIPNLGDAEKVALIHGEDEVETASAVASYFHDAGVATLPFAVPGSEAHKNFETMAWLAEEMADAALHRSDIVVAVGGEAVCDIAGFAAAIYNRGMRLVLVPTTLVGQADSAVGGKNALNLARGRNLVGTIHQPTAVICDISSALANRQTGFSAGLAEIAKHGLISTTGLLDAVRRNASRIRAGEAAMVQDVVVRSLEVKADIVSRDEREQGDRTFLNYGHTFAHAIEYARGPEADGGESLALGMMCAAHLAAIQGRLSEQEVTAHAQILQSLGLPISGPLDLDAMQEAWVRDKKYRRGVRFVLLKGLGSPQSGIPATREQLEAAVGRVTG